MQKRRESNEANLTVTGESTVGLESGLQSMKINYESTKNVVSKQIYSDIQPKSSKPVILFDPFIVYEFKPELCPRFPEKRETLSLEAGFTQTPVLKSNFFHSTASFLN